MHKYLINSNNDHHQDQKWHDLTLILKQIGDKSYNKPLWNLLNTVMATIEPRYTYFCNVFVSWKSLDSILFAVVIICLVLRLTSSFLIRCISLKVYFDRFYYFFSFVWKFIDFLKIVCNIFYCWFYFTKLKLPPN